MNQSVTPISNARLAELDMFFGSQIKTAYASKAAIAAAVKNAHLVIGAVLLCFVAPLHLWALRGPALVAAVRADDELLVQRQSAGLDVLH